MRSGFFNSDIQGYDNNGNPLYDRAEDAAFFAKYFSSFVGNGVYPNPSNNFQVEASSGMYIKVNPGLAFIEGYLAWEEVERKLTIQAASNVYDRIDRVILRLNFSSRSIDLYVLKGTAMSNPVPPAIERPVSGESGDIFELGLAEVFVAKNSTGISQHRIRDTRSDIEVCGFVTGLIQQVDTSTLYRQYQDALDSFFDIVQSALDETLAGTLQNQVNHLQNQVNRLQNRQRIILHVDKWQNWGSNVKAQVIEMNGATVNDSPDWDVNLDTVANKKGDLEPILEAFSNVYKVYAYNGGIVIIALETPQVSFAMTIRGI